MIILPMFINSNRNLATTVAYQDHQPYTSRSHVYVSRYYAINRWASRGVVCDDGWTCWCYVHTRDSSSNLHTMRANNASRWTHAPSISTEPKNRTELEMIVERGSLIFIFHEDNRLRRDQSAIPWILYTPKNLERVRISGKK